MKIIKTKSYLKKQAQWNDLPGDPNLPPGTTHDMIDRQFGEGEEQTFPRQSGEYEKQIDWSNETTNLINTGYDVQGLPQQGIGHIAVYYTYDAEVFGDQVEINNLKLLDIKILTEGKYQPLTVTEPATKEGIFAGLEDEIVDQEKMIIEEQSHNTGYYEEDEIM